MSVRKEEIQYVENTPIRVVHHMTSALRGPSSPHWHDEIELDYVLRGTVIYNINGTSIPVSQGEIVLINSGAIHSYSRKEHKHIEETSVEVLTVLLDNRLCLAYCKGENPVFKTLIREGENDPLRSVMTDIGIAFLRSDPYYELLLSAFALKLCHCLLLYHRLPEMEERGNRESSLAEIKQVLQYIEEHSSEKVTLSEIAERTNYNPAYFSRRFHNLTGVTFCEYLNRCRAKNAAGLLKSTDSNITDIALSCGFPNVKSMITQFKRIYRLTPEKYRREIAEKVKI